MFYLWDAFHSTRTSDERFGLSWSLLLPSVLVLSFVNKVIVNFLLWHIFSWYVLGKILIKITVVKVQLIFFNEIHLLRPWILVHVHWSCLGLRLCFPEDLFLYFYIQLKGGFNKKKGEVRIVLTTLPQREVLQHLCF